MRHAPIPSRPLYAATWPLNYSTSARTVLLPHMSQLKLPDILSGTILGSSSTLDDSVTDQLQLDRRLLKIQPVVGPMKPLMIEAFATDSVAELKALIEKQFKISAHTQVLSWNGIILRPNEALLESWKIPSGALLHLSVSMKTGRMKSPSSRSSNLFSYPIQVVLFLCRCDLQLFILEVSVSSRLLSSKSKKSLSYGGVLLVKRVETQDILLALSEKSDLEFEIPEIQRLVLRSIALSGSDDESDDDLSYTNTETCKDSDDESDYEDISDEESEENEVWSRLLPNVSRTIRRAGNLDQALPGSLKQSSIPSLSPRQAQKSSRVYYSKHEEIPAARLSTPPRRLPRIGSAKSKPGSPPTCSPLSSRKDLPPRSSSRLDVLPKNSVAKNCCYWCGTKLSPAAMMLPCKCGQHFCIKHRYSGRHGCQNQSTNK